MDTSSDKEPDELIDDSNDEETSINLNLPAISPVSNISSSSGFISCSSSTSSKPTTPTNLLTIDKNYEEYEESVNSSTNIHDNSSSKSSDEADGNGEYPVNSASSNSDDNEQDIRHSKIYSSPIPSTSKASAKSRVKSRRHLISRINYQQANNNNSIGNGAIIRHKSEEYSTSSSSSSQPSNTIVSILKRKDSSGKDTPPSLVTFSPNVKDNDNFESSTRSVHRQGILKKRSSLDESTRRFRSHSPSNEKGCLVKNDRRRNSCEEIHHQGILKQKSYESSTGYSSSGTRSSGINTPNSGVQGILKKPSLTPSDHSHDHTSTKHVSISEAVILAAAELCKDMIIDDSHEPYIKPILKMDCEHGSHHEIKPKPILKKNHSSENEEIRSILKSRKSSREEPDDL